MILAMTIRYLIVIFNPMANFDPVPRMELRKTPTYIQLEGLPPTSDIQSSISSTGEMRQTRAGCLPVKRALFLVTEPYLRLFRRLIPAARFGNVGLDLSALAGLVVLFIVIQLLDRV